MKYTFTGICIWGIILAKTDWQIQSHSTTKTDKETTDICVDVHVWRGEWAVCLSPSSKGFSENGIWDMYLMPSSKLWPGIDFASFLSLPIKRSMLVQIVRAMYMLTSILPRTPLNKSVPCGDPFQLWKPCVFPAAASHTLPVSYTLICVLLNPPPCIPPPLTRCLSCKSLELPSQLPADKNQNGWEPCSQQDFFRATVSSCCKCRKRFAIENEAIEVPGPYLYTLTNRNASALCKVPRLQKTLCDYKGRG